MKKSYLTQSLEVKYKLHACEIRDTAIKKELEQRM